jgi:hypothetical protein
MSKYVVIKSSSLPSRLPTSFAILFWLLLDRLDAPEWAYGVMWTLVGMLVVGFIYNLNSAEFQDVPGFGEK